MWVFYKASVLCAGYWPETATLSRELQLIPYALCSKIHWTMAYSTKIWQYVSNGHSNVEVCRV